MTNPVVTIGLPFFNHERTLVTAIRSILCQALLDWELLLVDDGSTDRSMALARTISDPRVRLISDGKSLGLAARLNQISGWARGEFVARMDDDDVMHPERLARQVEHLHRHPDIDVVGSAAVIIDQDDEPVGYRGHPVAGFDKSTILKRGLFIHPSTLARAEWARANRYDESLLRAQDLELWLRTAGRMRGAVLPEPLLFYRESTPVNVGSYRDSASVKQRLFAEHSQVLSRREGAMLAMRTRFSVTAYAAARWRCWHSFLLKRRSRGLSTEERTTAREVLASVRRTSLPVARSAGRDSRALVTVGIPFFNAKPSLLTAIRSVFAQTLQDWELILVDDGSTDGSLELARSIRDSRVFVMSDGMNRALPLRLNQIAQAARGQFLARMDADDVMHPERLARQVARFEEDTKLEVLGTGIYSLDASGAIRGARDTSPHHSGASLAFRGHFLVHPTVMFRTAWARSNPYDDLYVRAEDFELWCRVAESARIAGLPERLLYYREPDRIRLEAYRISQRSVRLALRRHGARLGKPAEARRLLVETYGKSILYSAAQLTGLDRMLVRGRSTPIDATERIAAERVLASVSRIAVPGILEDDGPAHSSARISQHQT